MGAVVGIDLGTTNSVVAILEGGEPQVVANQEGARTTPSVVAFEKTGTVLVGEVAKRQAITNPERTVRSIKREMGTKWKQQMTFEKDGGEESKTYTPQEISARILMKLKESAEEFLGTSVSSAVITVPAYFSDAQRTATQEAGKIAGLEVLRIINEPTAAALAYGMDSDKDQTILVFDLGGGTFDVSVMEIADGVFEVKATSGDARLGGDDWDKAIIDWLVESFDADNGVDLSGDNMAMQRLKEAAEKAKIELSQKTEAQINLPFITAKDSGPIHLDYTLSRSKFQAMTEGLLKRCRGPFERAIKDSGLSVDDLNHVLLVGGSTRMPAISELVKELTGREPDKSINPDEVVALGAAIQGGVLRGDVKDVLLLDVTPLTLGIETKGQVMTPLIKRNTTIPTQRSETFTTAAHNQSSVEINVLQGEREMARGNKTLGRFDLVDIPPAPAGTPQIEVTFDIDVNGIVNVTAKDKATGNKQSITITGQSGMSDDDIERMIKDAEEHAEEDRKFREHVNLRNEADTACYRAETLLKDQRDSLPAEMADDIEEKAKALRDMIGKDAEEWWSVREEGEVDVDGVRAATDELMQAMQDAGKHLYEQAGDGSGGGDYDGADSAYSDDDEFGGGRDYDGADSAFSDDSVVDAEVVDDEHEKAS